MNWFPPGASDVPSGNACGGGRPSLGLHELRELDSVPDLQFTHPLSMDNLFNFSVQRITTIIIIITLHLSGILNVPQPTFYTHCTVFLWLLSLGFSWESTGKILTFPPRIPFYHLQGLGVSQLCRILSFSFPVASIKSHFSEVSVAFLPDPSPVLCQYSHFSGTQVKRRGNKLPGNCLELDIFLWILANVQ